MVLVRSPKRGPWQRPASPTPVAATAEERELVAAAAGEQQLDSRPNDADQEGGSPRAAPDETGVALIAAAATGGRRSSADRGASYASVSFSPVLPSEKRRSRPSSLPRRKSVSCCAGAFSGIATQSNGGAACRRGVSRAAASAEAHGAAAVKVRSALGADVRNAAAVAAASAEAPAVAPGAPAGGRGNIAAAAREPAPRTAATLPFSRSAARRLARTPSHIAAAGGTHVDGAGDAAAAAAATLGRRRGFGAHRGSAVRHTSRVPAHTTGEIFLNSKAEALRPQPTRAAAAATYVSKRMRYGQQHSPPLSSRSNAEEMSRSSLDSRRIKTSFPLSREPSTSAAIPAADFTSSLRRRPAAATAPTQGVRSSPREGDSPAAMTPAGLVHSAQTAEGTTCSSRTEFPAAAAADLSAESQQQLQQHGVHAAELLQQLPATRALHDYVLEATSSGFLRHPHVKQKEFSAAAHLPGDIGAPAASVDYAVAKCPASGARQPALPLRTAPATTPLPSAAAGAAKTCLGPDAATSPRAASIFPRASAAAGCSSSIVAAGAVMAAAAASGTDHLAAAVTRPLAAAAAMVPGSAAAGGSARTFPSSTGNSGLNPATWITRSSSSGCEKHQQQLVLPRSAEELLREWSPIVDNLIQRLCDVREEEKQVTQFIILEGRSLRLLRHVAKTLEMKRIEVAAVHAKVAQQEAEQQEAHAESGKCFEVVHREAKDAAGGEVHLERRLKDTREKKKRLLQLRRQLYEEMFGCALLRQKKVELAKHLSSLKDFFAREEMQKNAIYQLLQRMTRLRLLRHIHGHYVLRVAVIPEGLTQHKLQQLEDEEEEDSLVPEQPEDERKLLLHQQRPSREEDNVLLLQHQQEGANKKKRHTCEQSAIHTQQQQEEREDHTDRLSETDDRRHRRHVIRAGVPTRDTNDDCALQLQYQRGMYVGSKAAKELHGFTKQFYPRHKTNERRNGSGSTAAEEETPDTGETESDVLSPCAEYSSDEEENCRKMIAAKTSGEAALITVDCRRRDSTAGVCRSIDALWRIIEDAIGLAPE